MKKDSLKKIWENKTVRYLLIGAVSLLLLLALWRTFGAEDTKATSLYEPSPQEARIAELLSDVEGIENANVLISESDGVIVNAVVVYEGTDSILVRMRILDITSAALNLSKQNVQVYPAK